MTRHRVENSFKIGSLRFLNVIDSIFPYQIVVYLSIFLWALYSLTWHEHWWFVKEGMDEREQIGVTVALLLAPSVALIGYALKDKIFGLWMSFAGDTSLWFALSAYAIELRPIGTPASTPFELPFTVFCSICFAVLIRVIRNIAFIIVIRRYPPISKEQVREAKESIRRRGAEKILEVESAQEIVELRQIEAILRETRNILKRK